MTKKTNPDAPADLDRIDAVALATLLEQGRITWADLGAALELSAPAAAERVRRLEGSGVIRGYTALLDAQRLGYGLTAFISVTLERSKHAPAFLKMVAALPEVQECHHVAGDHDYLLKVRCRNTLDLERLITQRLKAESLVARTHTTIVLSTSKETPAIPITPPAADE
ncbi:MAG: Lrp/AsnC family transcriptional regulator [Planctomycetia bacterium]|nr:Lrp/AsnC family transcriptional regulator [Planctomycetia bacterium]